MKFKEFEQGKLDFVRVVTKSKKQQSSRNLFLFGEEFYVCEDFVIEYYKSKGYDAFFSENKPWNKLVKILFKDIFKEFKRIRKEKKYKAGFYDNEFFKICENQINKHFDYLKNVDLIDEINNARIKQDLKNKIIKICECIDQEKILYVLYDWLQDFSKKTNGFPDLFVFKNDEGFFCEVKSIGDFLTAKQVRKHEVLINAGIDVTIFGVNKQEYWILEEKDKYFNEDFYDELSFKETYDFKIKIANRVYEELKNENIYEIRSYMFEHYDLNTFLGFLNILNDYSYDEKVEILKSLDENILLKSVDEGEKIKNLKYLSEGYYFEQRGYYRQAIEKYKQVKSYHGCNKLCVCYRKLKEFEKEVNLTYDVINNVDFVKEECKVYFKRRAHRFIKNSKKISVYKTGKKCPKCGDDEVIAILHRRGDIKINICMNGSCYWFGGIYNDSLKGFEEIQDLKNMQTDDSLKDSKLKQLHKDKVKRNKLKYKLELNQEKEKQFTNDKSFEENVEIKYNLVKKGDYLLTIGEYDDAIDFFIELLSNELFINDFYPYLNLSKAYHAKKDYKKEEGIIVKFFKSGIYCRKANLSFFKNRLENLEYSEINPLMDYYKSHGAKNRKLSNVPVPIADNLKKRSQYMNKSLKYPLNYFEEIMFYDSNLTYDEQVEFKKDLILKGELLLKDKDYDKTIVFYKGLLSHELFINDVYPHKVLSEVYKKDKRMDEESELLINFFKSGIYCDKNQIRYFKRRLKQLSKYGFLDYSKIDELELNFLEKGALNESLSNQPVPSKVNLK